MKSMTKLASLFTVDFNDDDCVILQIKTDKTWKLLQIPGFNGEEELIRMTKGEYHSYFIKYRSGASIQFSDREYMDLESAMRRETIRKTVIYSFGIVMDKSVNDDYGTNYIKHLADDLKRVHTYELAGFGKKATMSFRKNGGLLGMLSYDDAMEYLDEHFHGKISGPVHTKSPNTGCDIYTIVNVVD